MLRNKKIGQWMFFVLICLVLNSLFSPSPVAGSGTADIRLEFEIYSTWNSDYRYGLEETTVAVPLGETSTVSVSGWMEHPDDDYKRVVKRMSAEVVVDSEGSPSRVTWTWSDWEVKLSSSSLSIRVGGSMSIFAGYGEARTVEVHQDSAMGDLPLFLFLLMGLVLACAVGGGVFVWYWTNRKQVLISPASTSSEHRFCAKCGKPISGSVDFCSDCGYKPE